MIDARRPALVLGPAAELRADLVKLREWRQQTRPVVFAVNDAGWVHAGPIDHWVTLHWERMAFWLERRKARAAFGDLFETWTRQRPELVEQMPPIPSHFREPWETPRLGAPGTSGFYAVQIALHLGHERVVLAGLPMTPTDYADGAGTWKRTGDDGETRSDWPASEVEIHRPGWIHHRKRLECVRSCSGWTAELLGEPSREFLYG